MIINAIRYRGRAHDDWQAFKFGPGAGRFRNYQCVSAGAQTLGQLAAAVDYAFTGRESALIGDVSLQLSDDGGHTWMVHRRPGQTRVLRDGAPLPAESAEGSLAAALMDLDAAAEVGTVTLASFYIRADAESGTANLRLAPFQAAVTAEHNLREIAARQISEIAAECARTLSLPQLAEPRTLTNLTRKLEPLHTEYRELCRQYRELKGEMLGLSEQDLQASQTLAAEIAIMTQLDEAATPLLAPGVSLKGLKDELAKVTANISEIATALGIDIPAVDGPAPEILDFRKPIEALSRLEAYAKLIRASQGARKYCEQNLEPKYRKYFEGAEAGLAGDRQIAAELESCLASLSIRLHPRTVPTAVGREANSEHGLKTWFDRFKLAKVQPSTSERDEVEAEAPINADIETARMAIEYALGRLQELSGGVASARAKHDSALAAIDEAHEELVRSFGRLQSHWLTTARACHLPEELDLTGLLRIAMHHGKLVQLGEMRRDLSQKIKLYGSRLAKVEQLVIEWRRLTGSQKAADISNSGVLLTEARDVLRYLGTKRKRYEQLRNVGAELKAAHAIRHRLKTRREALVTAWQEAFRALAMTPMTLHDERLYELFQRANLVKALALVHGSAKPQPMKLFDARTESAAATMYVWDEARTDSKQRLAFLQQLEAAEGGELRLLLLADAKLTDLLSPLGLGLGSGVAKLAAAGAKAALLPEGGELGSHMPSDRQSLVTGRGVLSERPANAGVARPGAVTPVVRQAAPQRLAGGPPSAALLNDRAKRALELLAVKKP